MTENITIYTKNNCPGCMLLKTKMKALGYTFEEVNVVDFPDKIAWLKAQGIQQVPQLFIGDKHIGNNVSSLEHYLTNKD